MLTNEQIYQIKQAVYDRTMDTYELHDTIQDLADEVLTDREKYTALLDWRRDEIRPLYLR